MGPVMAGLEPQEPFFWPVMQRDGQWSKVVIKEVVFSICS